MVSEEGFLADILAHPDDNVPRLVYADWLDEHGDPVRADFIRVQIEKLQVSLEDDRGEELRVREGRLLFGQMQAWRTQWGMKTADLRLRRGFVEWLGISAAQWVRHRKKVVAATPLRDLSLSELKLPSLRTVLKSDTLAGLRLLDLSDNELGDELAVQVAQAPHVSRLQALHLRGCKLTSAGVTSLANSPHLANLKVLELSNNALGDDGATALGSTPFLKSLEELHLGSCAVGDAGAKALAGAAHLRGLKELALFLNDIGSAGARALVKSPHLQGLRTLYLNQNRLRPSTRKSLEQEWGERISCQPGRA
jgi:uncharacterized protein (TIGR02996 family)